MSMPLESPKKRKFNRPSSPSPNGEKDDGDDEDDDEQPQRLFSSPYTRIHPDWQTRILELHAAAFGSPLTADLHVIDLIQISGAVLHTQQRRIHYDALSYCWHGYDDGNDSNGSPESHTIRCNGITMPIMQNLSAALHRVRQTEENVYVWADAICINQDDLVERSSQVANMLNIFVKAQRVIVWLGEKREVRDEEIDSDEELLRPVVRRMTGSQEMQQLHRQLHSNPWFKRVWVKQEVWAADSITVRYGDEMIDWEDVLGAGLGDDFLRPSKAERLTIKDREERSDYHVYSNNGDIVNLMKRYRGSQSRDERDAVYGLLGMSATKVREADLDRMEGRNELVVDYTKSVAQVFGSLAAYLLKRDRRLGILYLDASYGEACGISDLPSWVPDWRNIGMGNWQYPFKDREASKRVTAYLEHIDRLATPIGGVFEVRSSILEVQGWTVGELREPFAEETTFLPGDTPISNVAMLTTAPSREPFQAKSSDFLAWIKKAHSILGPFTDDEFPTWRENIQEAPLTDFLPRTWAVSLSARANDIVVCVRGGILPIVLRADPESSSYKYVGMAVPHRRNGDPWRSELDDKYAGFGVTRHVPIVINGQAHEHIQHFVMAAVIPYAQSLETTFLQKYKLV